MTAIERGFDILLYAVATWFNHNVDRIRKRQFQPRPMLASVAEFVLEFLRILFREEFVAAWLPPLRRFFGVEAATKWRNLPAGDIADQLEGLQPTTRKSDQKALTEFDVIAQRNKWPLDTLCGLDRAVYRYLSVVTRSSGETLLAALTQVYPGPRRHLSWTTSRMAALAVASPAQHHLPLLWLIAVYLAFHRVLAGQPHVAGLLLLQGRLILCPSEAVAMRAIDLYPLSRLTTSGSMAFLKVGAFRPTKNRRPAVLRAYLTDPCANYLLKIFKRTTAPMARLTRLVVYCGRSGAYPSAIVLAHLPGRPALHCIRAGWAAFRHSIGQPVQEILEDDRRSSLNALRTYLDLVSVGDSMEHQLYQDRLATMQRLEAALYLWLLWHY